MISITRRLEIDAGHRLVNHEGKCRHLHGHRYVFQVTCTADELDDVGRVIDFGVIKTKVGNWLDAFLDHGMILQRGDPLAEVLAEADQKVFMMDEPPTAENLAKLVWDRADQILCNYPINVLKVRCHETPNCYADFPAQSVYIPKQKL